MYIAVGGIGNSKEASAFINSFECIDIAMWGEGEQAILELAKDLDSENSALLYHDTNPVPQSYFRTPRGKIDERNTLKKNYWKLSDIQYLDFSDFFSQYKGDKELITIPIEGSRGCHWNRCKFCFLNQGYKYRKKDVNYLLSEIRYYICTYNITSISFLDNDVIGKNLDIFDNLLDELIKLKEDVPDFRIVIAEIISKGISEPYIRKMHLAGFEHVQIGYESPSDSILAKIEKKNTFASNLLFIKWASLYSINIGGMNILRGLLDESDDDILEGIKNIYYLRFYIYEHNISSLAVNKASRYFKELKNNELESDVYIDPTKDMLPENYVPIEYQSTIYQYVRRYQNRLWDCFCAVDAYYRSNTYTYDLYKMDNNCILYTEYCNSCKINVIKFTPDELCWRILETCNSKVIARDNLYDIFSEDNNVIDNNVEILYKQGLLFYSPIRNECVSIINPFKIY